MEFNPVIVQVWGMLIWFIPAVLLIGLLKSPWAKSLTSEHLVRLFVHCQSDKQICHRLHDVTLRTPDITTQIDRVFLSPYGILVLETTGMGGWIFGSEMQVHWTQKLCKYMLIFHNPLRQNYKHFKALEALLALSQRACAWSSPLSAVSLSKPRCRIT